MKRYKEKGGKIYARITYTDAAGKQREVWRRAESKTEAKEIARQLEHQLKTQGSEAFEHHGTLDQDLDKWLISQKQVSLEALEKRLVFFEPKIQTNTAKGIPVMSGAQSGWAER